MLTMIAITEYTRLNDVIRQANRRIEQLEKELTDKKNECNTRMVENNQLRETIGRFEREREAASMYRMHPAAPVYSSPMPEHAYPPHPPHSSAELPPLRLHEAAGAMADVQYQQRPHQPNGYGHQF